MRSSSLRALGASIEVRSRPPDDAHELLDVWAALVSVAPCRRVWARDRVLVAMPGPHGIAFMEIPAAKIVREMRSAGEHNNVSMLEEHLRFGRAVLALDSDGRFYLSHFCERGSIS